jgi:hypothetical protein
MEYTPIEKETLNLMKRTDFKNLTKADVIGITSQLANLRPEVATEVLAQFPEFVKMAQSTMSEYSSILKDVIASDDESLKGFYSLTEKAIEADTQTTKEFIELSNRIREDLSKCLDNPDLSQEERQSIIEKEMEIFEAVKEKDTEVRESNKDYVRTGDKKDSEKRHFNANLLSAASGALILMVGIGFGLLGGDMNFKLPKGLH